MIDEKDSHQVASTSYNNWRKLLYNVVKLFVLFTLCISLFVPLSFSHEENLDLPYQPKSQGTRWLESNKGVQIKMLVEESNLGGKEVEIAEITFPVSYGKGSEHIHKSLEIFYVLSGELGHTVNGKLNVIKPGMMAIARPGDSVIHSVRSDIPVKALVIWAPAGEANRLVENFGYKQRSIH